MLPTTLLKIASLSIAASLPLTLTGVAQAGNTAQEETAAQTVLALTQNAKQDELLDYVNNHGSQENTYSSQYNFVAADMLAERSARSASRSSVRAPISTVSVQGFNEEGNSQVIQSDIEDMQEKAAAKKAKKIAEKKAAKKKAEKKAKKKAAAKKVKKAEVKQARKDEAARLAQEEVEAQAVQEATQAAPAAQSAPTQNNTPSASEAPQQSEKHAANTSGGNQGVVSIAKSLIGTPYVYGGGNPSSGLDCSGFTSYVYGQVGISLPRSSSAQRNAGTTISRAEAVPGDLIWSPGHVAIYLGGNSQIDAPRPGKSVQVRQIWQSNPTFIRLG